MPKAISSEQTVTNQVTLKVPACPVPPSIQSKAKVLFLKVTGLICVGLAILGAILPILPTTVFLLVAAACFAKSSPTMERKLLENKVFGPLIRDWQAHRSIPKKAKRIALLTMALSVIWSAYLLKNIFLSLLVLALIIGPFIFVARLPLSK